MEKKTKIYIGIASVIALGGIYYFTRGKKSTAKLIPTKSLSELDANLKKALNRFSDASPAGVTGKVPTQAEFDKGFIYLQKKLTDKEKQMFIDYTNSFMTGITSYATSPEALTDTELTGLFKVMSDTQGVLEKKYGKSDTDKFMIFMNAFDLKKI